jgi:CRISP-associated protein Cas1
VATLYLNEPGSKLYLRDGRYLIEKDDALLQDLPSETIDEVILVGGCQITTQAMRHLLARQAPLHLLTTSGFYLGRLQPALSGNVDLLKLQVRQADDAAFALEFSRLIVTAKLENTRTVLQRLQRQQAHATLSKAVTVHEDMLAKISATQDLNSLRGHEGIAAQNYFAALARTLPPEWTFDGRNRRPPRDPVNALLSFGYSLVLSRVISALQQIGLHLSIGFYHVVHGNRPSLALDLLEEYRAAIVDRLALGIISRNLLKPEQFTLSQDGCRLNSAARRRFLQLFEERLSQTISHADTTLLYRDLFLYQAKAFAKHLRGSEPYKPLRIR